MGILLASSAAGSLMWMVEWLTGGGLAIAEAALSLGWHMSPVWLLKGGGGDQARPWISDFGVVAALHKSRKQAATLALHDETAQWSESRQRRLTPLKYILVSQGCEAVWLSCRQGMKSLQPWPL